MPIKYVIDEKAGIISLTVSGLTDGMEWADAYLKIKGDPLRREDMNLIFDFRSHVTVTTGQVIESLARRITPKESPVKWALVVSREISRDKAGVLASRLKPKNIQVKSFDNMSFARAWSII